MCLKKKKICTWFCMYCFGKHLHVCLWWKSNPARGVRCTLRKWRVAMKRGVSFSWFFAHCSARGDKASKHSWLISELMLNTDVKEHKLHNNLLLSVFHGCTRQTGSYTYNQETICDKTEMTKDPVHCHQQGTLLSAAATFCKNVYFPHLLVRP